MKIHSFWRKLTLCAAVAGMALPAMAAPKKLLVVTVTTGFRHSSIGTAEKVLAQLAQETGAFTVDFVQQPPNQPSAPKRPKDAPVGDAFKEAEAKYKEASARWNEEVKAQLQKLSPANLKNYDGVVFANTTGDLPLPDKEGFIDWVNSGHAFIAMHSGSDTFHGFPKFIDMLGGEFQTHGAQVEVDCDVNDKSHPATKHLGSDYKLFDEIYIIKSYDQKKVHELLTLNSHPNSKAAGHYAVSWCKNFGQGKVFYTSLGHREDVWDPNEKNRKNGPDVAKDYQKHILGGINWALGLAPGDATPQAK
jgi:uncharacterized protein